MEMSAKKKTNKQTKKQTNKK